MSVSASVDLNNRLNELFVYIREGRIIDAMDEFYAGDVVMQENSLPPTVGREANYERKKQFLSMVNEWKGFELTAKSVGEDVTFYETVIDWTTTNDTPVHVEQVVVAKWNNGKITHEGYYHQS